MAPERALIVDDPRFERHVAPQSHPERPERLEAARRGVDEHTGTFAAVTPRLATHEELARVHDAAFLSSLDRLRGQSGYIDADTFVSPESVETALLAAGSLAALVEGIIASENASEKPAGEKGPCKGIALLRPPGHHATSDHAMGFCLLNNVAVAAAHARARGIERVAVVDWDVHHGNGTQEIFWSDPHVLYVSTHQFPLYPGTGALEEVGQGEGKGFTVNVPLAAGGGDAIYASAFERIILPILEAYAPELVLVSAGFDAAARDPLAQMELSAEAFGWMARELSRVADKSAKGKMAIVLEGGYDLPSIEAGVRCSIEGAILGREFIVGRDNDSAVVNRAARVAKRAWSVVGV
jgi:acetoin utilization deacetylase AcuC-like enzyme